MSINHSIAGIVRRDGKFLIAKRKPGGALSEKWEFPGGKVEQGETDREAIIREWDEEFRIDVEPGVFICSGTFSHKGKDFLLSAYEVTLLSENFQLLEHTEIQWKTMDTIEKMDVADSDRGLFSQIKEFYSLN
ncbi:(deoxy)nucleoside triphosphate pyrophosphohydrolase [Spirochaeta isovalerica]|uniref:8-oxo-dGTP diphosphatase n=1 Tax=Spirochaeta isovalerica TaxID=150 RepID=A0A841R491_9SPIO|nr:NUDIX domain-containing protein [Spirochaeta isovalerica]MBB6478675.1 8-oxo-dGTP diphosphatase [Spirochaeta isovalerica]